MPDWESWRTRSRFLPASSRTALACLTALTWWRSTLSWSPSRRQAQRGASLAEGGRGLLELQFVVARFDLGEQVALVHDAADIDGEALQAAGDLGAERGSFLR